MFYHPNFGYQHCVLEQAFTVYSYRVNTSCVVKYIAENIFVKKTQRGQKNQLVRTI